MFLTFFIWREGGIVCRGNSKLGKLQCFVGKFSATGIQALQIRWRDLWIISWTLQISFSSWLCMGSDQSLYWPTWNCFQVQALGVLWRPFQGACSYWEDGPILWLGNSQGTTLTIDMFGFDYFEKEIMHFLKGGS